MKIRYITTKTDVVRGSLRSFFFNRALRLYTLLLLVAVSGLSVSEQLEAGRGLGFIVLYVVFQFVCIFALILGGLIFVTAVNLFFTNGRGVIGEHELVLSADGLTEKTDVNESLHKWKRLGEIRTTSCYYFLRVNDSGGAYHILPRRRPLLEGNVETFVAEFRRHVQRA